MKSTVEDGIISKVTDKLPRRGGSVQELLHGNAFSVFRHKVIEPGGGPIVRDIIHHPGAAVILPVAADGRILLVRQYRLAAKSFLWELPAGTLDGRESPLAGARREFAEETGYTAARWKKLVAFFPSPGILNEKMTILLAQELRAGAAHPEADEHIVARFFSAGELLAKIQAGRIHDAKTMIGVLYWQLWCEGKATRSSSRTSRKK